MKLIAREFVDEVWGVDEVELSGVLIGEDVLEIRQMAVVGTGGFFLRVVFWHGLESSLE